jgi:hypothetical protein
MKKDYTAKHSIMDPNPSNIKYIESKSFPSSTNYDHQRIMKQMEKIYISGMGHKKILKQSKLRC